MGEFTGINKAIRGSKQLLLEGRNDFEIPNELSPTIIVGFGYPARKLTGMRKNRLPLDKLVYCEKYGNSNKV